MGTHRGRGERRFPPVIGISLTLLLSVQVAGFSGGCAVPQPTLSVQGHPAPLPVDAILETATGAIIARNELVQRLSTASIVYVGESHTNRDHHAVQLAVIQALAPDNPDLAIGMEMFNRPSQEVLDAYLAGNLTEREFLKKSNYYEMWGYDYRLYRDIINFAKKHKLPIVALNIEKEMVSKVYKNGGLAALFAALIEPSQGHTCIQ